MIAAEKCVLEMHSMHSMHSKGRRIGRRVVRVLWRGLWEFDASMRGCCLVNSRSLLLIG